MYFHYKNKIYLEDLSYKTLHIKESYIDVLVRKFKIIFPNISRAFFFFW